MMYHRFLRLLALRCATNMIAFASLPAAIHAAALESLPAQTLPEEYTLAPIAEDDDDEASDYEYEYNISGESFTTDVAKAASTCSSSVHPSGNDRAGLVDFGDGLAGVVCEGQGVDASLYAQKAVEHFLKLSCHASEASPEAQEKVYTAIDAHMAHLPPASGTTAVSFVAVRRKGGFDRIVISHTGDARAVIATLPGGAKYRKRRIITTADHNFCNAHEVERYKLAQAVSGHGEAALPSGVTALRYLGHHRLKARLPGVLGTEPDGMQFTLLGPTLVILASKHLWDYVGSEEAVALAQASYLDAGGQKLRQVEEATIAKLTALANYRAKTKLSLSLLVRVLAPAGRP